SGAQTPVGGFTDFPTLFRKSDVPQQFTYFQPLGTITGQTPVGGYADFPEIVATRQVPQQFAYFQPQGTITQVVTSNFLNNNFRLAVRRYRLIGQFEAQIAESPPTPEGWRNYQFDYSLIKPVKAIIQQFSGIV